jgi:hypothetical protein
MATFSNYHIFKLSHFLGKLSEGGEFAVFLAGFVGGDTEISLAAFEVF